MSDTSLMVQQEENALLHLAVIEENLDVVRFLLKHGVPATGRALKKQLSVEFKTDVEHQSHVKASLDLVLQNELDADRIEDILAKTTTALHLAVRNESTEIPELLVQHGAEVNAEMEGGETPLIIAVLAGRKATVEFLLEHGADVNARTAWGKSALHYAAQTGQESMVETLSKHGAHVNATNVDGLTALHMAAEAGQAGAVAMLLRCGADVDVKTRKGASVLHYAAVMDHKDVVELLIQQGADVNVIMKHGGLDLSTFNWITPDEEKKAWELVQKYASKMSLVSWYGSLVRHYKKSKESKKPLIQDEAEQQQ